MLFKLNLKRLRKLHRLIQTAPRIQWIQFKLLLRGRNLPKADLSPMTSCLFCLTKTVMESELPPDFVVILRIKMSQFSCPKGRTIPFLVFAHTNIHPLCIYVVCTHALFFWNGLKGCDPAVKWSNSPVWRLVLYSVSCFAWPPTSYSPSDWSD